MVRRIVQQLDDCSGRVDEFHPALKELRAHATALRAIADLDLDMRNNRPFLRRDILPPVHQAVHDEIAGLEGASKGQISAPSSSSTLPKGVYFSSHPLSWSAVRASPRVFPPRE